MGQKLAKEKFSIVVGIKLYEGYKFDNSHLIFPTPIPYVSGSFGNVALRLILVRRCAVLYGGSREGARWQGLYRERIRLIRSLLIRTGSGKLIPRNVIMRKK